MKKKKNGTMQKIQYFFSPEPHQNQKQKKNSTYLYSKTKNFLVKKKVY